MRVSVNSLSDILMSSDIDDYILQAYFDEELSPNDKKRVEKALQDEPELRERYKNLLKLQRLMTQWWQRLH